MVERSAVRAACAIVRRVVCVLVFAGLVAACDHCGDFLPPIKFQACNTAPPPSPQ